MDDIVTTLREAVCLPNTGCISATMCVCDVMQDAADEIKALREEVRQLRVEAGYD